MENRVGAGGLIGVAAAANAEPDGSTFVISGVAYTVIAPAGSRAPPLLDCEQSVGQAARYCSGSLKFGPGRPCGRPHTLRVSSPAHDTSDLCEELGSKLRASGLVPSGGKFSLMSGPKLSSSERGAVKEPDETAELGANTGVSVLGIPAHTAGT